MGQSGHDRVVERFLPDTQLARWASLIAAVMGADGPPATEPADFG